MIRTDFKSRDRVGDGSMTLMIGLSRSGKTRWVNIYCHSNKAVVISADDVRRAFGVEFDTHLEPMVKSVVYYSAAAQLARGEHVIIDATNLTVHARRPWLELARHMKVRVYVREVVQPQDEGTYRARVDADDFPWGVVLKQRTEYESFDINELAGLAYDYHPVPNIIDKEWQCTNRLK